MNKLNQKGSIFLIIVIIMFLLIIGVAVAGYYFYSQSTNRPLTSSPATSVQSSDNIMGLQKELESMIIEDVEVGFVEVDKDLSSI